MVFVTTTKKSVYVPDTEKSGEAFDWLGQCSLEELDIEDVNSDNTILFCKTERADDLALMVHNLYYAQYHSASDGEGEKIWELFCTSDNNKHFIEALKHYGLPHVSIAGIVSRLALKLNSKKMESEMVEISENIAAPYIVRRDLNIPDDVRDMEILNEAVANREKRENPRIGDFIMFSDGVLHRFSHDWGDALQTSEHGSYYLLRSGGVSMSGSLDPAIPKDRILNSGQHRMGAVWFFHREWRQASNAVHAMIPCRVYATDLTSKHWHNKEKKGETTSD